jgi:hypothetical protein
MNGVGPHFNDTHDDGLLAAEVDKFIDQTFTERLPERDQAIRVIRAADALDPAHCPTCHDLQVLGHHGIDVATGDSSADRQEVLAAADQIAEKVNPWLSR